MARRPLTNPRKQASQTRSRVMVDALVEATARILVCDGFDKASTNRIADVAGASIGSLYQYFPSKEALVAAVIDRHDSQIMRRVRTALSDIAAQPIERAVRSLVAVAVDAHRINPKLRRVLREQVPHIGRLENVEVLNREGYALFRGYLESRRDELRVRDLDLAAFMCATSIETLTHTAVLYQTETPRDAEALVEETTRFISGYLQPTPV